MACDELQGSYIIQTGEYLKKGSTTTFKKNPINYAFKMYGFRVLFLTANYCILFQINYFHLVEFSKLVLSKVVNGLNKAFFLETSGWWGKVYQSKVQRNEWQLFYPHNSNTILFITQVDRWVQRKEQRMSTSMLQTFCG